jgi:hypothetical protein
VADQLVREMFVPASARCTHCIDPAGVAAVNAAFRPGAVGAWRCPGCGRWSCDRCSFLRVKWEKHVCGRKVRQGTFRGAD